MKKLAFIIPGFGETEENNPAYRKIAGYFQKKGIRPVVVDIDWKRKVLSDYVAQFEVIYRRQAKAGDQTYLLGFSLGAMIAFIASSKLKPETVILCSLSPYFKEDLHMVKKWWSDIIGKRRMKDFEGISFTRLARSVSAKTIILAGDKEGPEVESRTKDAKKRIKGSKLVTMPGVRHEIGQKKYLAAIREVVENL